MAPAHGNLTPDDTVLVDDEAEASRLRDKGAYGQRAGNRLELDLNEATYLVEENRLVVHGSDGEPVPVETLLALGSTRTDRFEAEHLVYRDYRARGYVIRRGEDELDAWARGAQPPGQAPSTLVVPRGEAESATPGTLLGLVARSHGLGRGLLVGVVDEESDVTYYETDLAHVTGSVDDPAPGAADGARARVLRDRAILETDPGLAGAGYGHTVGDTVFLSLAEAHHLARHGAELVDAQNNPIDAGDVAKRARRRHARADAALDAYAWLRERGMVPKTGFKFGVHYRVYDEDPADSHAPYLVQGLPEDAPMTFRDVARFVRLAHSVKKRAILWTPAGALMPAWTRP